MPSFSPHTLRKNSAKRYLSLSLTLSASFVPLMAIYIYIYIKESFKDELHAPM